MSGHLECEALPVLRTSLQNRDVQTPIDPK